MNKVQVKDVLEEITELNFEDQEYIIEVVKKRLIELKRTELLTTAKQAKDDYEKGNVKRGTVADFWKDINDNSDLEQ